MAEENSTTQRRAGCFTCHLIVHVDVNEPNGIPFSREIELPFTPFVGLIIDIDLLKNSDWKEHFPQIVVEYMFWHSEESAFFLKCHINIGYEKKAEAISHMGDYGFDEANEDGHVMNLIYGNGDTPIWFHATNKEIVERIERLDKTISDLGKKLKPKRKKKAKKAKINGRAKRPNIDPSMN